MNCMVGYVSHWTQLFSISCGSVYLLRFITFWFLSLTIEWAITTASLSKRVLHLLHMFLYLSFPSHLSLLCHCIFLSFFLSSILYLFPYCLLWICLLFLSHSLFLLTCLPVSIQPPPCLPPLTIWLVSPFNVDFGQSSKISQSPKRSYRNINIPSAKTGKACTKKEIKRKRDYKNSWKWCHTGRKQWIVLLYISKTIELYNRIECLRIVKKNE